MSDFSLLKGVTINRAPFFFHCSPSWSADMVLSDCDLWQVHGGRGQVTLDGERYDIEAGSSFIYVPGMRLVGTHDREDPLRVFAVHFTPQFSRKVDLERFFQPYQGWRLRERSRFHDWALQCIDAYHGDPVIGVGQANALLLTMLFQLWREANARSVSNKDAGVDALLSEIRTHPERKWTIEMMCRFSSLSSTYLNQRVRAKVGASPMQYVIESRVERARTLIEESAMSLEEIAYSLGYRDVYFFNRQFSKTTGITPGQYCQKRRSA